MNNFSDEIRLVRKLTNNPHLVISDLPAHSYTYDAVDGLVRIPSAVTEYWVNLAMMLSDKKSFKKIFKDKLKELGSDLYELRKNFIKDYGNCTNKAEKLLVESSHKIREGYLLSRIEEFEILLQVVTEKNGKSIDLKMQMRELIEKAKAIPITTVLSMLGIAIDKHFIKCPNHDEGTPSCRIYENQNRYWSYCCNSGGDSISLVQTVTGKNFRDTLRFLLPA